MCSGFLDSLSPLDLLLLCNSKLQESPMFQLISSSGNFRSKSMTLPWQVQPSKVLTFQDCSLKVQDGTVTRIALHNHSQWSSTTECPSSNSNQPQLKVSKKSKRVKTCTVVQLTCTQSEQEFVKNPRTCLQSCYPSSLELTQQIKAIKISGPREVLPC